MPNHRSQKANEVQINYLIGLMDSIHPLSDLLKSEIRTHVVAFQFKKDELIVEDNGYCHYMYFIQKGALMGRTIYKGKKIVTYISIENEFVSSISGLYAKNVSKEEITAIEDSEVLALSTDTLQQLFLTHFDFNFLFRIILEQYYKDAQECAHIVRVGSAKERYLYFAQTTVGYMERLPIEYVAGLLDMTPLTFAKIKKQYEISRENDKEIEKLCKCLEISMIEKKAFKDKNLSLNSLSKQLHLSTHRLSSLLNNQFQQKFMDFVNTYRINYIKAQIAIPDILHNYTIETIANNAGFSSRSAFYNAFKKMVGMSPVEFVRSLQLTEVQEKVMADYTSA